MRLLPAAPDRRQAARGAAARGSATACLQNREKKISIKITYNFRLVIMIKKHNLMMCISMPRERSKDVKREKMKRKMHIQPEKQCKRKARSHKHEKVSPSVIE